MSKSDSWENGVLLLLFNNTAFANVGNAGGLLPSSVAGSLYLSLHTSDPGEAGTQSTNEINTTQYQNYVRVAVARSSAGWTVTGGSCVLAANMDFAAAGAGSTGATVTHFGVGTASSGAGVLLYKGTVTPNIVVGNGVTPRLTTGTTITED